MDEKVSGRSKSYTYVLGETESIPPVSYLISVLLNGLFSTFAVGGRGAASHHPFLPFMFGLVFCGRDGASATI